MNIRQIIEQWLRANGCDGLTTVDCGCEVDDLMPCDGECIANCKAGYKVSCPGEADCPVGGCPWHISTSKPKGGKDAKEENPKNQD